MFSSVSGSRVFTRCASVAYIYALSLHTVMMGVLVAIEFLVSWLAVASFYLLGQNFVFCTRCDCFSLFYLLGQISCFVHAVMAIASFYLLGQNFVFCTRCDGYSLFSCFVHAMMALACFRVLSTL